MTLRGWVFGASLLILGACNNYDLDSRIRGNTSTSGSSNSGIVFSYISLPPIPYSNKSLSTFQLANITSGGRPPYAYVLLSHTLPSIMTISLSSAGLLTYGKNNGVGIPTNIGSNNPAQISVKVTDSDGLTTTQTFNAMATFKRIFVTKDAVTGDNLTWNTGASYNYSACSTGTTIDRANCRCTTAAVGVNLPNPQKYRAMLSHSGIADAKCNAMGLVGVGCSPLANDGGPWYNMSGAIFAQDMSTTAGIGLLASTGSMPNSIQFQEDGVSAGGASVWTGSSIGGTASANNCSNWSGAASGEFGLANSVASTAGGWLDNTLVGCPGSGRLYCLETD